MSNAYYSLQTFTKNTLARAEDLNTFSAAVVSAFDILPLIAEIKEERISYATTGGSADVYTATMPYTVSAYTAGFHARLKIHAANTGASTLNVDGVGAVAMQRPNGDALTSGDLPLNSVMDVTYDGSVFKIGSTLSDATAAAASAAAAAADAVLTAADVVSTNADVVSTNADVVSTNADVVTTTALAAKLPTVVASEFLQANGGATAYLSKSASEMRTALSVQPLDAQLTDVAGLAVTNSGFIVGDGANFVLETGATTRTSLGLTIDTDVQSHVMTTQGDMVRAGASGAPERVAIGASGTVLTSDGTDAAWAANGATGDIKMHMGTTVQSGWLELNGETLAITTGDNTGSTYNALYEHLWDNLADGQFAIAGGRGGSAAADWAADKAGTMPDARGRALIGYGTGAGLTARTIGDDTIGSEDSTNVTHTHGFGSLTAASDGAHVHDLPNLKTGGGGGDFTPNDASGSASSTALTVVSNGAHTHSLTGSLDNQGSAADDTNTGASIAIMTLIKL